MKTCHPKAMLLALFLLSGSYSWSQTAAPATAPATSKALPKLPPPPTLPANATAAQKEEYQRQTADYERRRWNYVLTDSAARVRVLNEAPNTLLVESVKNHPVGTALDVGMGEGRNALYLAQLGWQVTGVDIADEALAYAQKKARAMKVKITTVQQDADRFDWGTNKWDLIVLSYAGGREYAPKVMQALKPGGLVVLEGFHKDATQTMKIGDGVVYSTNELKTLYSAAGLKIVRYEEPLGTADFGKREVRLVKLVARK
ncbi:class I SAM-dependent methyltransferase [Hymenobacter cellulosilyticus]|uniref:Class I SAM-dependent methyltransferase n=1 Tax=Hymenobacter cellulosilyticus TaxID=2932248 RepID=A0A8T9Q4A6_9BACT|nr:class I SAM-dependent methyltransferase [Hymenobacter cellulosilyticus]UOQ72414.1 class I SAM-dependent methyltransferase [Hymenobacter cellulosilyticus]